jgi:pyrroline-5-carboxylate reductase
MLADKKLGIIGTGNMGGAIIGGLIKVGLLKPEKIFAFDVDDKKLDEFCQTHRINKCASNTEVVKQSDLILLSVKPQNMREVLEDIEPAVTDDKSFLTVAAGIPTVFIEGLLKKDIPVVRAMPNTPGLIGSGATAIAPGRLANEVDMKIAETIFSSIGIVVMAEEKDLDAVTALSGSGPAYFFLLIECLTKAGVAVGLSEEMAETLAKQTALGAAQLALNSDDTPAELRKKVTSKGGTTEAALNVFQDEKYEDIVKKAIKAATDRAGELSRQA